MDEYADAYLVPREFKVKFSNELFKYSNVSSNENPDRLLQQWTVEHKKRASILPRKRFLHWQIEQAEFANEMSKIYKDSLNDDTAFARAWFYILKQPLFAGHSQQTDAKIESFAENSFMRLCAEEILTWFWSAEKFALVKYYNNEYPDDDERRIVILYKSRDKADGKLKRPTTAVSLSNLARFRIRRYFEEKQGVLFTDNWLNQGSPMTTAQIKNKILNLMLAFHREIDENLIPFLPIASKKKRSIEITISQECTKSAHNSAKSYLNVLAHSKGGIKVECKTQERKLALSIDKIKDDLKAPIIELARNQRVRFNPEEITNYIEECMAIVEKHLSIDEFQQHPLMVQFAKLISNEAIPTNASENYLVDRLELTRQNIMKLGKCPTTIESGIFVVEMSKVWHTLQERGYIVVQKCTRQIRECFHNSVSDLEAEFIKFKKTLSFRSIDPTAMLKNKAEVNVLCAENIPKAVSTLLDAYERMFKLTRLIQLDQREHEYLINVAGLRRTIPRHIADHNLFFQRRLHIFSHFVRKREADVQANAQNALNRMKILNNFTDPDEVQSYLEEMKALKPLILTLHQELIELNEQQRVVNLPLLSLREIEVIGNQINSLWSLFESTKRFNDYKTNFYKRRRIEVQVKECQMFIDSFVHTITDLSVKLESQRAAKIFLSHLKTEIEQFRHNIPVLEVMSCARLNARHWEKMSEIVGFNLALFENATAAQICELNLNVYISKLKPIAFIADREGQISDQANFITDYWAETPFLMDPTQFWGIHVPNNLDILIKSATEHISKIKAYRDPDDKSFINENLDSWIRNLNNLLNLLKRWNSLLKVWKRISDVMRYSHSKLPNEFDHFRTLAKYFRRLARFVDEERFAIKLIEGKHIDCWLSLGNKHLKIVVEGLDAYLHNVRIGSARMCLISDSDVMKLLSMPSVEKGLNIIQRECFPLLRELYLNEDQHLFGITSEGERFKLENYVQISVLRDQEPQIFVTKLEKAISEFIIKDYVKYMEHHSSVKTAFRLTRIINDAILHSNQESGFKLIYEDEALKINLRGNPLQLEVVPDFVHSSVPATTVDVSFSHNWAQGKIPLFYGNISETRFRVQTMCRNLLCTSRFVNCHPTINSNVFDIIAEACQQSSVLFVLENVDQLTEDLYKYLLLCLTKIEKECARLILCTTVHQTAQHLSRHVKIFHSKIAVARAESGDAKTGRSSLNVAAVMKQKNSLNKPPISIPETSLKKSTTDEDDLMNVIFGEATNLTTVNFSIACIGPTARLILNDCIERGKVKVSWIYIDALTYSQVISGGKEFGEASSGYLIKCLKDAMQAEEPPHSARGSTPATSAPQTQRPESKPQTAETTTTTTDESLRRLSITYKTPKYIIFYGFQQFPIHFPQISSLFYSMSNNVVSEMPPGAYLSMGDGSNFYAAKNIRFILCMPTQNEMITTWLNRYEIKIVNVSEKTKNSPRQYWDKFRSKLDSIFRRDEYLDIVESAIDSLFFPVIDALRFSEYMQLEDMFICLEKDIEEAMIFVNNANYGEVLRSVTLNCCVNFMITYIEGDCDVLDRLIEQKANSWDRSTSELGKIPFPISQHKLLSAEHASWEKVVDETKVKMSMKKEYSLSEMFVDFTKVDRIIAYVIRQFHVSDKHFILTGKNFVGKSANIERIITQLEKMISDYNFIRMDCTGRFDLVEMQGKLSAISLTNKRACIIIDHFDFFESSNALLELYNDLSLLIKQDEPQMCTSQLRLILVTETSQLEKCYSFGQFRKNFQIVPIKPLSETELNYVLEKLVIWHLNTKTFSSEYLSIVPLLANASQQIFKIFGKKVDQLLPYFIRLAKGLMFAFPDNTPDLDSMLRLWLHEILRLLYDRELNEEALQGYLKKIDYVLEEVFKTNLEKLFPSKRPNTEDEEEEEDVEYYGRKDVITWVDFKLEKLLFSEIARMETMDGINYGIVRRNEHNKALEGLHFEYTKNNEGFHIDLVVTDFTGDHCQRLMRVLRQHNEHIALAGQPGCGRKQCIKLAAFGTVGFVYHTFFDIQSAEAFENSWKSVIIKVINVLACLNQPICVVYHLDYNIDKIPPEWLIMLKQWLQRPVVKDLLSDTLLIKMAEKIIESEKTLATMVQSSNIRLPGQRYCQFVSFEAYKNVDLLRSTLEARIADFLHAVFLIPPSYLNRFEWCTGDYYKPITSTESKLMLDKVANECVATNKSRLSDTIEQVLYSTRQIISQTEFNCLKFFEDSKIVYDLAQNTVNSFNRRNGQLEERTNLLNSAIKTTMAIKELSIIGAKTTLFELYRKQDDQELVMQFLKRWLGESADELEQVKEKMEKLQKECESISDKLLQRNAKIGFVLDAPINQFQESSEKLTIYGPADYVKITKLKTPSLGLRYTIEAVRRLVEKNFKPSRNHLEAWSASINALSNKEFCDRVINFDPNRINSTQLKALTAIIENQDLKEQRLIVESPLAADLCKWIKSAEIFAKSNKQLKTHKRVANELSQDLSKKQKQVMNSKEKEEFLLRRLTRLEREIEQQDRTIHKLNRLIFYRQRGDMILQVLGPLQNRWKTMIGGSKSRLDNLLGNSIIQSAFRVLFGCLSAEVKISVLSKIRSSLLRYNINYDEKFTAVPTLAIEYLRWISWHEPWPLIQTKRPDFLTALKYFYGDCAVLDIGQLRWTDKEVIDKLLRSSYSDTPLIITNVKSSPPAYWFEILLREPDKEKRVVEFMESSILMGEHFKLVFITERELSSFEAEFLRMITPIKLDESFDLKGSQIGDSLLPTEEDLLKMLTDYSAIDILEAEEVTNQIIQLAEAVSL